MSGAEPDWAPHEVATLVQLRRDGVGWPLIGKALDRSPSACRSKWHRDRFSLTRAEREAALLAPVDDVDHVNLLNDLGGFPRGDGRRWVDAFGEPWRFAA